MAAAIALLPSAQSVPTSLLLNAPKLQVQKALIDMENMFELLNTKPNVGDPPSGGQLLQV